MKTMLRNLLFVLTVVGWVSVAPAELHFTETFNYPNGALTTVSGNLWTRYSTDQDSPIQVANEQISLFHACSGGPCNELRFYEDLQRSFPAAAAGQTIYAGFDVTESGAAIGGLYFAHFLAGSSHVNRLFVTPFTGSDFTLGIGNGTSPSVSWPSGLTNNTAYRVVLSYEFNSGTSRLWINPANQSSANISFTDVASSPISAFGVRQTTVVFIAQKTQVLDNLVVGTRFRDVLAIPTPPLAGDYDGSGTVGPEDYDFWKANFGSNNLDADGNGDGFVDGGDYVIWRKNLGATLGLGSGSLVAGPNVPEPASLLLCTFGFAAAGILRRRRRKISEIR
jgi:hypothetical protein